MSLDLGTDLDPKYLSDNLLLTEDWDLQQVDEDLAQFLDIESAITNDDLIKQLPEDLELPMLDDASLYASVQCMDEGSHLSDSSDSGLSECFPVKEEPLSPALSHCSEHSNDSLTSQVPMDCTLPESLLPSNSDLGFVYNPGQSFLKYETPDTPPHTPPRDANILPPTSITMPTTSFPMPTTAISMPTRASPSGNTIKLVIPAQGANGAVNVTHVLGGAQGGLVKPPGGVTQVLNAKVKIQPKPATSSASSTTAKPASRPAHSLPQGKPLVLTPAEFNKLTAQGVLKFNPPATGESKPSISINHPGVSLGSRVSSPGVSLGSRATTPAPPSYGSQDIEVANKLAKRQQRMIKNRESACLSRKRKKEYMSTLEVRLHNYNSENEKLRQENEHLKKKVHTLQSENERLKGSGSGVQPVTMKKGVTILLGVMLLVSLNLGPLTSILQMGGPSKGISSYHTGRTLLSFNEKETGEKFPGPDAPGFSLPSEKNRKFRDEDYRPLSSGQSSRELMLIKQMEDLNLHQMASMCPTHFNTTESMRVLKELRGWVLGHEESTKRDHQNSKFQPPKRKTPKKYQPPRKMKAAMNGGLSQFSTGNNRPIGQYDLQVFTGQNQYNQFMDQIHRRNDTFYVVSFRRDHFLLPATSHNKTTRPRMSLVMPALGLNETMHAPDGSISMMQIDCEVTHTQLVHIQKSAVPEHLMENATNGQPQQGEAPYRHHAEPQYQHHREPQFRRNTKEDLGWN